MTANRGGPQRPLSDAELGVKFSDNTRGRLSAETAGTVRLAALSLDTLTDVSALLRPLAAFTV